MKHRAHIFNFFFLAIFCLIVVKSPGQEYISKKFILSKPAASSFILCSDGDQSFYLIKSFYPENIKIQQLLNFYSSQCFKTRFTSISYSEKDSTVKIQLANLPFPHKKTGNHQYWYEERYESLFLKSLLGTLFSLEKVNKAEIYFEGTEVSENIFPNFISRDKNRYNLYVYEPGDEVKSAYKTFFIIPILDQANDSALGFTPKLLGADHSLSLAEATKKYFSFRQKHNYGSERSYVGTGVEADVQYSDSLLTISISSSDVKNYNVSGIIEGLLRSATYSFKQELGKLREIRLVNKATNTEYIITLK